MRRPTHIFVISDLHLGGSPPAMMSFPGELAKFIRSLPSRAESDESIELVIAGDVVDFLAIESSGCTDAWTSDPARAVEKLRAGIRGPDRIVFEALAEHVERNHGLTILVGNHDLELALPAVQTELCAELRCRPGEIHFVDDGRAWRFGQVLIEHGNRYDDANLNDWSSLREIAASQSRGEAPLSELEPSFGSQLVQEVVNRYKQTFEFIDTLQPQGVLVAYLMAAFEPGLIARLPVLRKVWKGQSLEARNAVGRPPRRRTTRGKFVAASTMLADEVYGPQIDTSHLDEAFGLSERLVRRGHIQAVVRETLRPEDESLFAYLSNDRPVPQWRLELVQKTLLQMTWDDRSLELDGPCGPYGAAAQRLRRSTGARVVVMGHTHQARHIGPPHLAEYINTGTWVDIVVVPTAALASTSAGLDALEAWLKALSRDRKVRMLRPTWAELLVDPDGTLIRARLERGTPVHSA
ncbi:hypothetical protein [Nannocystis sp. SCPEA4]|uniref:hypothetical protein n=1 Tax=Nannocystis sp. SCPEA4 TaxID=2996787 RepID=UPI00226FE0EA|nr:hypothetical protein [Nannocystis sp. SCPEA4]MCY1058863.1 hypothetical protein [Nannocystis sp. SCPEA4]